METIYKVQDTQVESENNIIIEVTRTEPQPDIVRIVEYKVGDIKLRLEQISNQFISLENEKDELEMILTKAKTDE